MQRRITIRCINEHALFAQRGAAAKTGVDILSNALGLAAIGALLGEGTPSPEMTNMLADYGILVEAPDGGNPQNGAVNRKNDPIWN